MLELIHKIGSLLNPFGKHNTHTWQVHEEDEVFSKNKVKPYDKEEDKNEGSEQ